MNVTPNVYVFAVFLSLYLCTQSHAEVLSRSVGFSQSAESNIALKNHLLRSLQRVRTPTRCLATCLRESKCVAVNYSQQSGICELTDGTKTEYPGDVTEESGWMYYEVESKTQRNLTPPVLMKTEASTPTPQTLASTTVDPRPKDCWDYFRNGERTSRKYTIYVKGKPEGLDVFCQMDNYGGGGWTKIQHRENGNFDFYRDWNEYKTGFGDLQSEFWMGLDNLHLITSQDVYQLRILLLFDEYDWTFAMYDEFHVANENDNYTLTIAKYTGERQAGDSMIREHNGMPWSTYDKDNDNAEGNCAEINYGAWWYNNCQTSNLNGPYRSYRYLSGNDKGVTWESWTGNYESLAEVDMKIKPLSAGN